MSSSLSFSIPLPSQRNGGHLRKPGVLLKKPMKVMATAQGRENLDHLPKANNRQPQAPPQPKKTVAQNAPVGIWDRFPTARTVQQMMDTMERIMEDPLGYPTPPEVNGGGSYRRGRTPWEIKEGAEEFKMRFDMPGMTKRDVKVWLEEKMLVVKAEKLPKSSSQGGAQGEEEEWSAKSYGRYNSRIALPENVELEKIKAEVKDGVLYITIPKVRTSTKVLDIEVK